MTKTVFFWQSLIGDKSKVADYSKVIEQLLSGHYQSLDLEKLRGHNVYSVRLNHTDRLLFTTYEVNGVPYLLILDVVLNHRYHKSPFLNSSVIKNYVAKHAEALNAQVTAEDFIRVENDALPVFQQAEEEQQEIQYESVDYYDKKFIVLNDLQDEARHTTLPLIVTGAAGSGKSCVAQAILEQCLQQSSDETFLYVTASERLAKTMESLWLQFHENNGTVHFMSYNQLLRKHAENIDENKWVGDEHCLTWLANYIKDNRKLYRKKVMPVSESFLLELTKMHQEFRIICASPTKYNELGVKQSLFHAEEEKVWLSSAFSLYEQHLKTKNLIDPAFYLLEAGKSYDVIVADEAQDLSLLQLSILEKLADGNICFCLDPHQSLYDAQSKIPFLSTLLRSERGEVNLIELPSSYRCPPEIIKTANGFLTLKNFLHNGAGHKGEYVNIPFRDHGENIGEVHWLDEHSFSVLTEINQQLAANIDFIVITHAEHKEEAKSIFNTPQVFTPEEIKGLEFKFVVGFKLLDTEEGYLANNQLRQKLEAGLNPYSSTTSNRPKKKGEKVSDLSPFFNNLVTAVTRSMHTLFLYEPGNHKTKSLASFIRNHIHPENQTSTLSLPKVTATTSNEEWLEQADRLRNRGLTQQADEIVQTYSPAQIKSAPVASTSTQKKAAASPTVKKAPTRRSPTIKTQPTPPQSPLIPAVKPKFVLTKAEEGYLRKLKKGFSVSSLKPLFKNKQRTSALVLNTPFAGMNSIFFYALQDKQAAAVFSQLGPTKLEMLSVLRSYGVDENGHAMPLFFFMSKFISHNHVLFRAFLKNKSFAEQITKECLCACYSNPNAEFNSTALYWLSKGEGQLILKDLLTVNPQIALQISAIELSRKILDNTSVFYYLSKTGLGVEILHILLELNPSIARAMTRSHINVHLLPQSSPINVSPLYWLATSDAGIELIIKLIELNLYLPMQLSRSDLFQTQKPGSEDENSVTFFQWITTYELGQRLLLKLVKVNPKLAVEITGMDLTRTTKNPHLPRFNASPFFCLATSVFGQELLTKLVSYNIHIAKQITNDDLYQPADEKILRTSISPFYAFARSEYGCRLLMAIMTINPELAHFTVDQLCLVETSTDSIYCNASPLFWLTSTHEGRDLLDKLFEINPDVVTSLTLESLTKQLLHLHTDCEHLSPLDWLLSNTEGCKILAKLLNANCKLANDIASSDVLFVDVREKLDIQCQADDGEAAQEILKLLVKIRIESARHDASLKTLPSQSLFNLAKSVGEKVLPSFFLST